MADQDQDQLLLDPQGIQPAQVPVDPAALQRALAQTQKDPGNKIYKPWDPASQQAAVSGGPGGFSSAAVAPNQVTPTGNPLLSAVSGTSGQPINPAMMPNMPPPDTGTTASGGMIPTGAMPGQDTISQMPRVPQGAGREGIPNQPVKGHFAPLLARMLMTAFKGAPNGPATGGGAGNIGAQPGQPGSRLDAFEGFLGEFLDSFSRGLMNSGQGPAANARGFGNAVQGPYQHQQELIQNQQMQQARQAQAEQAQAQTGLATAETARTQAQTRMVPVQPYGPQGPTLYFPPAEAAKITQSQIQAQSRITAAGTQKRFMSTPYGVMDTQANGGKGGYINGPNGGMMGTTTVSPELAQELGAPDLAGTTQKISDVSSLLRAVSQGTGVAQGSEGAFLVNKMRAQATGGKQGVTPLGQGSPAANPIAQQRLAISSAEQARTVQVQQGQVDIAIKRLQTLSDHADVLSSMIDAGKLQLVMGGDGIMKGALARNVTLTKEEREFAEAFINTGEDINLLRLPQGGGGFRSEEAFANMQAQRGSLYQRPDIFKGVVDNTIESMKALYDANRAALDVYNRTLNNGKNKATGGGNAKSNDPLGIR